MKIVHHYVTSVLWSLIILWWIFVNRESYTEYIESRHIQIGLQIVNSYSGWIDFSSGQNMIYSGWSWWTDSNQILLQISATTGSAFTISWDVVSSSWVGSWGYSLAFPIQLSSGDGNKLIQSEFLRDANEEYMSNIVSINLDQTPPSASTLQTPALYSTVSPGMVFFSWTPSIDNGAGTSHYKLHISPDPGFLWGLTLPIYDTNTSIYSTNLSTGMLFRYVESMDYLWNSSSSSISSFINTVQSLPTPPPPTPVTTTWESRAWGGNIETPESPSITRDKLPIQEPIMSRQIGKLMRWIINHNKSEGLDYYNIHELLPLLTGADNTHLDENIPRVLRFKKMLLSKYYYINNAKRPETLLSSGDFNPTLYGENFIHTIIIKRDNKERETTIRNILQKIMKKISKYLTK